MNGTAHWEDVYRTKAPDRVSWFQPEPRPSQEALARHGAGPDQAFIDIGGGASSLAGALALAGWRDLAVLDISSAVLERVRAAYALLEAWREDHITPGGAHQAFTWCVFRRQN